MSRSVKQEKQVSQQQRDEDREYDDWARKLVTKPTPQIGVQQNLTGSALAPIFLGQQQQHQDPIPPNSGFDRDSAIGKFSWVTIADDKNVPCIFRNKDLYVAIRMAEISVIGELLNVLPAELYESAKITSYYATQAEAKLLTYINSWHCDGFFGPDPFTILDLVISLVDLQKFYEYLFFAFCVLHSGGKNIDSEFKHCGFVRVNSESMIPYTVLEDNEKGVPLFYFEGQIGILKDKALACTGWPLAYLKVCCKVQGVRKDLISNPTLQIVTLSGLQAVFPKRTTFTDKCWPPPKPKTLLPKQVLTGAMNSALLQITSDRWTNVENNETFPNYTTSGKTLTTNSATISTVVMNPKNGVPANVTLSCNGVPTNYQIPKTVQSRDPALAKLKISTPPIDRSKLVQIPEHPDGFKDGAYVVRLIMLENQFMHCINAKPGQKMEYLMVLQGFINSFYPSVSIYPTAVSVLRNIGILTYLPNRAQIKALNNFGFQINDGWQLPLIPAVEAQNAMGKLRQLLKPRSTIMTTITTPTTLGSSNNNRVTNGGNNNYPRTYSRR